MKKKKKNLDKEELLLSSGVPLPVQTCIMEPGTLCGGCHQSAPQRLCTLTQKHGENAEPWKLTSIRLILLHTYTHAHMHSTAPHSWLKVRFVEISKLSMLCQTVILIEPLDLRWRTRRNTFTDKETPGYNNSIRHVIIYQMLWCTSVISWWLSGPGHCYICLVPNISLHIVQGVLQQPCFLFMIVENADMWIYSVHGVCSHTIPVKLSLTSKVIFTWFYFILFFYLLSLGLWWMESSSTVMQIHMWKKKEKVHIFVDTCVTHLDHIFD